MKILILGAGKWALFADVLSFDHEVAVLDPDPKKLRFIYNTQRMTNPAEVEAFARNWSSMPQHSSTPSGFSRCCPICLRPVF